MPKDSPLPQKKSAAIIIMVVVGVFIASAFAIWYLKDPSLQAPSLQDADVVNLVSFLKQKNISAAVVQKIASSNYGSTWLVKSDGEKIFLYSKNLGAIGEGLSPLPAYDTLIGDVDAAGVSVLPDQAEVYDLSLNKIYDISSYLTGHPVNASANIEFYDPTEAESIPNALSPDGKYLVNYADQLQHNTSTIQLTKVNPDGSVTPLFQFSPTYSFLAWSIDSNYILMMQDPEDPNRGLEVYDIKDATTMHIDATPDLPSGRFSFDASGFLAFIYPSQVIFGDDQPSRSSELLSADLTNLDQTETTILPNGIKIAGFIP
jgi:hypothetical protein